MSANEPGGASESMDENSTPYLQPEAGESPSKDGGELESEPATMDPAEEVRMRRDLQLELENFEQGIQG